MNEDKLALARNWLVQCRKLSPQDLPNPTAPAVQWVAQTDVAALMESILADATDARDAVHRLYESFHAQLPHARQLHEQGVDWLLNEAAKRRINLEALRREVQESPLFDGVSSVERFGRRVTRELLMQVMFAASLGNQSAATPHTTLEIGGGHGELTRLLRLLTPNASLSTHFILDIPEALCFAFLFLTQTFPNDEMLLVTSAEDLQKVDRGRHRFVLVPFTLAHALAGQEFDLVIAASALGGPASTGITDWISFTQETIRVKKIVGLVRFLNTDRPGRAPWHPPQTTGATGFDARWRVLDWELEPSYLCCPFAAQLYPRCVHVVAERTQTPTDPEPRSAALLEDVKNHVMYRHLDGDALEGTCWDHALIHDSGMTGPLFKLWESIRLQPNIANVRLMIQTMDRLLHMGGSTFEELPLYESLLMRLSKECNDAQAQKEVRAWLGDRLRERPDPAALAAYLQQILPDIKNERIVCYGVGQDFQAIAKAGVFAGSNIIGLIDDRRPSGNQVEGFTVYAPSELTTLKPDVVVATSSRFGSVLRERARGMVLALSLSTRVM